MTAHERMQWRVLDKHAIAALVEQYLPFAHKQAGLFHGKADLDDLRQIAAIGLLKAILRFDPEQGVEFTTYAHPVIHGEIKHYLRDHAQAIRTPRDQPAYAMSSLDAEPIDRPVPATEYDQVDDRDWQNSVLNRLHRKNRALVVLGLHGYRGYQLAAALGVTQQHANRMLRRAATALRVALAA